MRNILLLLTFFSLLVPVAGQELPTFINVNTEDALPARYTFFEEAVAYGEQFVVSYRVTNPATNTDRPVLHYYNDDGTLAATEELEAAENARFNRSATSPDGAKAWFAGNVVVTGESDNYQDIAVAYGNGTSFTYGRINLAREEVLRNVTASDDALYALVETRSEQNSDDFLTVAQVNSELSLVNSVQTDRPEGFFPDNLLYNVELNSVLIIYRRGEEVKLVGVNMTTGTSLEYTIPALNVACGNGEAIVSATGFAAVEEPVFFLLTTCQNFLVVGGNSVTLVQTSNNPADVSLSLFSTALVPVTNSFSSVEVLVLENGTYRAISITDGIPTITESGSYGGVIFLNPEGVFRTTSGKYLVPISPFNGDFAIVDEGAAGMWASTDATQLQLPGTLLTGTQGWKIAKIGDDIIGTIQQDSLARQQGFIQFFGPNGEPQESFMLENRGVSKAVGLDNGNFAVFIIRFDETTFVYKQNIVEFNRAQGIIGTLASWNVNAGFEGSFWHRIAKISNGDLIVVNNTFDDIFTPLIDVRRFTQDGTEIFAITLPDSLAQNFRFAPLSVDNEDNIYLSIPAGNGSAKGVYLASLDMTGSLRYVSTVASELSFSNEYEIVANGEGDLTLIGRGFDGNNRPQAVLIDIDQATGAGINETLLAPDLYTYYLFGDYISGSDSLALYHNYYGGDESDVSEQNLNRVLFLDENRDLFYVQEVFDPQANLLPLRDVDVSDDRNLYVIGRQEVDDLNASFATLIGVDFSNLAAAVRVDEFAVATALNVSPNPTADLINISWDNATASTYELEVLNTEGRRMLYRRGELIIGRASLEVDLSRWPTGTYLLQLTTPDGVSTQRIVRQ